MSNEITMNSAPESNKVARSITLVQLSARALLCGIDMGFNAAEVIGWCDPETFEDRFQVIWGDREVMRRDRMRVPQEYALSYDMEAACIRTPLVLDLPSNVLSLAVNELDGLFNAGLLELAQDSCVHHRAERQDLA